MYEISEIEVVVVIAAAVVIVVVISLGVSDDLKRTVKWNNLMYRKKIITGDIKDWGVIWLSNKQIWNDFE